MASIPDPLLVVETLAALENRFRHVMKRLLTDTDFTKKYDLNYRNVFDGALFYLSTKQSTFVCYAIEVFTLIQDQPLAASKKRVEELTYPLMFEDAIERYTRTRKKPNPVLMETRAAECCYLVYIKIEAVPIEWAKRPVHFMLLREFQVLQHIWENYRAEFLANKCNTDQLIGFPIIFEFKNIESTDYDLPQGRGSEFEYYSPTGKLEPMQRVTMSLLGSTSESRSVKSTLSYMSREKVGPSLSYLMELMMSQGKRFSVSSALKVFDQLISRLIILHKYSVVHCDINPAALSFGTAEAVNVLYINDFDTALVVGPTTHAPLPIFHDRFVAHTRVKDKTAHYVNDIESAFYVFLYLLLGSLPWDARLAGLETESCVTNTENAPMDLRADKSRTVEDKENFWQSSSQFSWSFKSIEMEFKDTLYRNFTCDIVESIYHKIKEGIATCQIISPAVYSKNVFSPGSAPYNAYFGIRKIIASYFRFETRSNALKDPVWTAKTEILFKEDERDKRMGWDMSLWCWNYLDTSISTGQSQTGSITLK